MQWPVFPYMYYSYITDLGLALYSLQPDKALLPSQLHLLIRNKVTVINFQSKND